MYSLFSETLWSEAEQQNLESIEEQQMPEVEVSDGWDKQLKPNTLQNDYNRSNN